MWISGGLLRDRSYLVLKDKTWKVILGMLCINLKFWMLPFHLLCHFVPFLCHTKYRMFM